MPRKLKVFRTPTGFHDAYVAAPSRKAALAAWGSDADLFARGVAEEVTEPGLMAEPLARPGEVIRLSRGDLPAQLKALGPRRRKAVPAGKPGKAAGKAARKPRRERPPSREKVAAAEAALAEARQRHARETGAAEAQLAALRVRHARETARLERVRDRAREAYRSALANWSE